MKNKETTKSIQAIVCTAYIFAMVLVVLEVLVKLGGIDSTTAKVTVCVVGVFSVVLIVITCIKSVTDYVHGICMTTFTVLAVVLLAASVKQYIFVQAGILLTTAALCFYGISGIMIYDIFLTVAVYIALAVYRLVVDGITGPMVAVFLLEAAITIFSEYAVSFIIRKLNRQKQVIKDSSSNSQDMLKVVQIKKVEAEEAVKAKSAFLSNMSHEIRTPINAMLGMDEIILRESNESNIIEYASRIQSAGSMLLSLINDILDFSKIEAGKMEIVPENYDVAEVINELYNLIYFRAENKGLKANFNIAHDIPAMLNGDALRIKQICMNVLTNAVKYTERGHITFDMKCRRMTDGTVFLDISVEDTGMGIKEEEISKLFSSFDRINENRTKYIEGTGLGMSITKSLLDLMGGSISVKSVYGEGSTFYVSIPQQIIDGTEIGHFKINPNVEKPKYKESLVAPEADILIVDDNEMNLMVVKGLIKKTKVKIDTATSGIQCLEMVQNKKYHIIFMDHMMPVMDGIETFEKMRELENNKSKDATVIALTANAVAGSKEMYLSKGFADYLSKPVEGRKIEEMMRKYLPEELVTVKVDEVAKTKVSPSKNTVINFESGLNYAADDKDTYIETINIFLEMADEKRKLMESFIESEDWKNYTIEAHALKSNARYLGADMLADIAYEHENFGKQFDGVSIRQEWPRLVTEWDKVIECAGEYTGVKKKAAVKTNGIVMDEDRFSSYVQKIVDSLNDFDADMAEKLIGEILEHEISDKQRELMTAVQEEINRFGYQKAVALLTDR